MCIFYLFMYILENVLVILFIYLVLFNLVKRVTHHLTIKGRQNKQGFDLHLFR